MSWILYALSAVGLVSLTNIAEKFLIEKRIKSEYFITILYGSISFLLGVLIILWHGIQFIPLVSFIYILLSGVLLGWYLIPYFKALSLDETSRVVPIFQSIPIFVLFLSFIFLHEVLTIRELISFLIIIIGGTILSVEKFEGKILKPRASLWYMLISSFMYSVSLILFKGAVIKIDFLTSFSYQAIGTGIGTLLLLAYPPYFTLATKEIKKISLSTGSILVGTHAIGFISELLSFYAVLLAPAALVSVVGGIQPFIVLIYTTIISLLFPHIIKEDLRFSVLVTKGLAMLFVFIGIAILYL